MTIQLEKIFFNYILTSKKYYDIVKPYFFRNNEIKFIYTVLQSYILKNRDCKIPTPTQLYNMVALEDKEGIITKEILKSILKSQLKEYDEEHFIIPKLNAWILVNRLKDGSVDIIDEVRNLDNINEFDDASVISNKIKEICNSMTTLDYIQDDNIGSDFDDVESHIQDSSRYKIKSGFDTIDHMLGGGWDISTLNIIMAETSNGKCVDYNMLIKCKNKKTEEIFETKIGDLFLKISQKK